MQKVAYEGLMWYGVNEPLARLIAERGEVEWKESDTPPDYLLGAFEWADQPEGIGYWSDMHDCFTSSHYSGPTVPSESHSVASSAVVSPKHYMLTINNEDAQVKDVCKAFFDKVEKEADEPLSLNQAGWVMQALQYLLRAPFKGTLKQDIGKAVECLNIVLKDMED